MQPRETNGVRDLQQEPKQELELGRRCPLKCRLQIAALLKEIALVY
jgi:hypothetical protein